jgi:hypothetical protein
LHTELAAVGLPVVGAETDGTSRFGAGTQARGREFQKRYGLRETADADAGTDGLSGLCAMPFAPATMRLQTPVSQRLHDFRDFPDQSTIIDPDAQPQPPEPYLQNLYSCREDLLEQSRVPELPGELGSL